MILISGCRLAAPDGFLDAAGDTAALRRTLSLRDGAELWSGAISGELPKGVEAVQGRFDGGAWKAADVLGIRWHLFIPQGKAAWPIGSKHTVEIRALAANGNTRSREAIRLSFTQQVNRDTNADGYADMLSVASSNMSFRGIAYVYYGGATGITGHAGTPYSCNGPPDCTTITEPVNDGISTIGTSAAFAGDVNGDGYGDIIIGSDGADGTAYIYYGSASGITSHATGAAYTCNGPPDCTVISNPDGVSGDGYGLFGSSVAFAGDVNADGYADVIVGARDNPGTGLFTNKGAVYIFYGGPTGTTSHPRVIFGGDEAYACNGPPDCTVVQNPDEAVGQFGYSVASAGDVNADGYADVIVGAPLNQGTGAVEKGVAYIFYGSPTGITGHAIDANFYTCNGPPDCTVMQNPENASDQFGFFVSWAGDVNADGYADVVVGAYRTKAYVFYGSATGITNHPVNSTPYSCSGPPDCTTITNTESDAGRSLYSVAFAGDINADGYADIIVGQPYNDGSVENDKGAAYIFYGGATGIVGHTTAAYACSGPPDCTEIQNPENQFNGVFAWSVSTAGDVNAHGYADIIAGAAGNTGGGATYVFYGGTTGVTGHPTGAAPYTCNGFPDCTELRNPDPGGQFGSAVAFADFERIDRPAGSPLTHWGQKHEEFALPARREEATA